jgi:hypothetical protein
VIELLVEYGRYLEVTDHLVQVNNMRIVGRLNRHYSFEHRRKDLGEKRILPFMVLSEIH